MLVGHLRERLVLIADRVRSRVLRHEVPDVNLAAVLRTDGHLHVLAHAHLDVAKLGLRGVPRLAVLNVRQDPDVAQGRLREVLVERAGERLKTRLIASLAIPRILEGDGLARRDELATSLFLNDLAFTADGEVVADLALAVPYVFRQVYVCHLPDDLHASLPPRCVLLLRALHIPGRWHVRFRQRLSEALAKGVQAALGQLLAISVLKLVLAEEAELAQAASLLQVTCPLLLVLLVARLRLVLLDLRLLLLDSQLVLFLSDHARLVLDS